VGGTSPFGCKSALPVYVEKSIWDLETIYINGGKRGFLVAVSPQALKSLSAADVAVAV
uniref:YbaK/EbsC family protein n=1 Tax=Neisseria dentiae TaxID=194197 RepID=UPI0035A1B84C